LLAKLIAAEAACEAAYPEPARWKSCLLLKALLLNNLLLVEAACSEAVAAEAACW
jgi:hypothetical protein